VKDSGPPARVWRTGGGHELPGQSRSSDGWHRRQSPDMAGDAVPPRPAASVGRRDGADSRALVITPADRRLREGGDGAAGG